MEHGKLKDEVINSLMRNENDLRELMTLKSKKMTYAEVVERPSSRPAIRSVVKNSTTARIKLTDTSLPTSSLPTDEKLHDLKKSLQSSLPVSSCRINSIRKAPGGVVISTSDIETANSLLELPNMSKIKKISPEILIINPEIEEHSD